MSLQRSKFFYVKYLVSFFLALLYFLFQFHFMQRFLDCDQGLYVYNISYMLNDPKLIYFNPHHLHFEWFGSLFHKCMIQFFGDKGFVDLPFNLRIWVLLFGSLGIFSISIFLIKITKKISLGVIGGLLVGFAHGYFHYSSKIDTAIFPVSIAFVILWCLYEISQVKHKRNGIILTVILGILFYISMMFHQYSIITSAIVLLSLLVPAGIFQIKKRKNFNIAQKAVKPWIDRSILNRYGVFFGSIFIAAPLVILSYLYAGKVNYNLPFDKPNPKTALGRVNHFTFSQWLFMYKIEGTHHNWGTGLCKFPVAKPLRGFTDGFLSQKQFGPKYNFNYTFNYNFNKPFSKGSLSYNSLVLICLVLIISIMLWFFDLLRKYKRVFFSVLALFIMFVLLAIYWESNYFEFWVMPVSLFMVLVVMVSNVIIEKLQFIFKRFSFVPVYLLLIFFLCLVGFHNLRYYIVPHARYAWVDKQMGIFTWKDEYYNGLKSYLPYKNFYDPYQKLYGNKNLKLYFGTDKK